MMLRKITIALLAAATVGLVSPTVASARGGHGGGGFHGGGFHGGFHGGGFHHGFYGRGFGYGLGFGYPYAYGWGYPYGYGYPYAYGGYVDDGGCYLTRRRVHTRHGWRWRRVEVCG